MQQTHRHFATAASKKINKGQLKTVATPRDGDMHGSQRSAHLPQSAAS